MTSVRVWELEEPPPRTWIMPDLIPEEATTVLYGDGGQGKSYIALALADAVCTGGKFANVPMAEGPVLYLDAELDEKTFRRRAFQIARGLGRERPPDGASLSNTNCVIARLAPASIFFLRISKS